MSNMKKILFCLGFTLVLSACITRADIENLKQICRRQEQVAEMDPLNQCMVNYNKLQAICLEKTD